MLDKTNPEKKLGVRTCKSFILSAKSLISISSRITKIMAVQTSMRKSDLVSSDNNESQILKTSGNGNSWESIRVSHLKEEDPITISFYKSLTSTDTLFCDHILPEWKILWLYILIDQSFIYFGIHGIYFHHEFLHHSINS